jgi:hypothetical protein
MAGEIHFGTLGEIISECWGDFIPESRAASLSDALPSFRK